VTSSTGFYYAVRKWAIFTCENFLQGGYSSKKKVIILVVRIEVFTGVTVKNAVFLDVALCTQKIYIALHPRRRHSSIILAVYK
jgi:hypothetical protein